MDDNMKNVMVRLERINAENRLPSGVRQLPALRSSTWLAQRLGLDKLDLQRHAAESRPHRVRQHAQRGPHCLCVANLRSPKPYTTIYRLGWCPYIIKLDYSTSSGSWIASSTDSSRSSPSRLSHYEWVWWPVCRWDEMSIMNEMPISTILYD